MPRRAPKEPDLRLPDEFVKHISSNLVSDQSGQITRFALTPFPEPEGGLWRFFDSWFGLSSAAAFARRCYEELPGIVTDAEREYISPAEINKVGMFLSGGVFYEWQRPGADVLVRAVHTDSRYSWNPLNSRIPRRLVSGELPPELLDEMVRMEEWLNEAFIRKEAYVAAVNFLRTVAAGCGCTLSLCRALPGLRQIATLPQVLGPNRTDAATLPMRGKDFVNTHKIDAELPLWRTKWQEHRDVLMLLAQSKAAVTYEGVVGSVPTGMAFYLVYTP